ncbi:hypothetical protein [Undibacterium squillarum]|uniref:hypothetical protein n=1 Tax=Undibacterium squillarum TaxID=1131567 RepID=UPI001E553E73|nr:hypothetical protein [Undibacterium squillarum]
MAHHDQSQHASNGKLRTSAGNGNHVARTADCANIVIYDFRRPGLSADDRRIGMQNSAFEPVLAIFQAFSDIYSVLRITQDCVPCMNAPPPRNRQQKKTPA